jgi:hypothetical protein
VSRPGLEVLMVFNNAFIIIFLMCFEVFLI